MSSFIVTPLTAKDKTRIAEHGDVWIDARVRHIKLPDKVLLESVSTKYVRWWYNNQVRLKED